MVLGNEGDLLAAQERISELEALVTSLLSKIEVLEAQKATLQESIHTLQKSTVVHQEMKQECLVDHSKLATCHHTCDFASSSSRAIDVSNEVKGAQTTFQSNLTQRLEEDRQIINLLPELFETHVIARSTKQKGDLSHYSRRHVALKIMYLGARFHGFASDASAQTTVESELFDALEKTRLVLGGRLKSNYTRCGRTDKGVSANGQVVALLLRSFQKGSNCIVLSEDQDRIAAAISSRSEESCFSNMIDSEEIDYVGVLNRALPLDIRVLGWCYVPLKFHARFSCLSREYNYFFINEGLDIEAMKRAARKMCGEHDFRNFCRMDADNVQSFRREILAFEILPCLDKYEGIKLWMFQVTGTAFLWHQVRCMVAVLLMVGQNKESESVVDDLLDVQKTSRKPQYVMAPESPLVLQSCNFKGLSFYCSPNSARFLHQHVRTLMNEHLNAIALLKQLKLEMPSFDDSKITKPSTAKKSAHVPLLYRQTEPTYSERRIKLQKKRITNPITVNR